MQLTLLVVFHTEILWIVCVDRLVVVLLVSSPQERRNLKLMIDMQWA